MICIVASDTLFGRNFFVFWDILYVWRKT